MDRDRDANKGERMNTTNALIAANIAIPTAIANLTNAGYTVSERVTRTGTHYAIHNNRRAYVGYIGPVGGETITEAGFSAVLHVVEFEAILATIAGT